MRANFAPKAITKLPKCLSIKALIGVPHRCISSAIRKNLKPLARKIEDKNPPSESLQNPAEIVIALKGTGKKLPAKQTARKS